MLHKGNSYKSVSLFQQYIFDEIIFCKNLFCVNTDQAETFQVVENSLAQLSKIKVLAHKMANYSFLYQKSSEELFKSKPEADSAFDL